jgi:hypothetical protein
MTVRPMAALTLRELDGHRASFREVLAKHEPYTILVTDQAGRCLEVDLFPDGADAWLLKITSAGRVLFDCGGHGVAGLTDEAIAFAVVASFRALDTPPPEPN